MTWKKFFLFFFLQWIIFAFTKVWLLTGQVFENGQIQGFLFLVILLVVSVALCRRFGVINFLEAIFIFTFWFFGTLFLDLVFTTLYTGVDIFKNTTYWTGFLAIGFGIIFMHKMRHLHIRHTMHAAAHGHGPGPAHGSKSHGDHHQQPHGQHPPGKHH